MRTSLVVCCLHVFLQFMLCNRTMADVSTACYGVPGIGCTDHRLTCIPSLVISITNITFGYRRGCSISGVASCVNITCCSEQIEDCFTPYNQTLVSQLQQICNGRSTCTLNRYNGLNERSSYCYNGIPIKHSYSKIEYQCVANTTPPTTQPTTETAPSTITKTISNTITSNQASTGLTAPSSTPQPTTETASSEIISNTIASNQASTDLANTQELSTLARDCTATDTDVGGIVGGIVGVIIVIGIVAVVIFFVKRRLKKVKSQTEHQYDSASSRISNQPTPVDDSLNTRSQTRDINEQLSATTNGQTPTNDYEHAYDSAPSRTTDGPKAVYDSLNPREQTGYYNMGIINVTTNNGRTPTNTNNPDYEHAYSALDHDTNKPRTVYDSLNTREQTGYYNMGSINTTEESQQPGTNKDTA